MINLEVLNILKLKQLYASKNVNLVIKYSNFKLFKRMKERFAKMKTLLTVQLALDSDHLSLF